MTGPIACLDCGCGLSRWNVSGYCRRCSGVRLLRQNRRCRYPVTMTPEKIAAAQAASAEGLNMGRIADRIGVSRKLFYRWYQANPFPVPGKGVPVERHKGGVARTFTPDVIARLHEVHAQGMYMAQAARHLGLSASSLSRWNRTALLWPLGGQAESIRAWCRDHPEERARIAAAAWESRRRAEAERRAANAAKIARWRAQAQRAVDRRETA